MAVDETYVGGKSRTRYGEKPRFGRSTKKTPVVALVERGGRVRARRMVKPTKENLQAVIRENVHPTAAIHTDQFRSYHGIGDHFAGGHHTVNHAEGEYARDGVHVNDAEAFFALLKRGIVGSFHHVSVEHMPKYLDEFSFRWTHRKASDGERTEEAIRNTEGRRLTYKPLVSH